MIPVNEPLVTEKELAYVTDAVKSGWISSEGVYIDRFEAAVAKYVGRKYAVAVNNGTSALILAVRALNLLPGSEVIIPSFTIISCALACINNDLVPVFVDAEPLTWNLDVSKIEAKITSKTKAIMPVHIYGHPAEMFEIERIAKKHNLIIIEDFAEAIGSEYKGRKCGSFGDISCVSFYANKVITTGEGGMCLTDNPDLAAKLKKLKNLAFIPETRFIHQELGFNFRMTNVQAAMGLAQTEHVVAHVEKKRHIGAMYNKLLAPLAEKGLVTLPVELEGIVNTYWMYGVVLSDRLNITAAQMMEKLKGMGIQTRPFFYPMHQQPAFEKFSWYKKQVLHVSEKLYKYGFYLPTGLTLADAQVESSANALIKAVS
ncbi:MAG: hypothetical protein A2270_07280 [Elusimicrobia bacterium RIFOXYA12_FULL_51_18]|nr:MAG: hypothetical protein A2270_07280 [Elusimicrobia bacterium RIFOXYA12_FULL_51_18]OGS28484.1 MAG: hypothetical protein A2218_05585 [Elusimicrobia bacterium RIFOXYA2_FULL_53_38]